MTEERVARAAYLAHRPRNKGWLTLLAHERKCWLNSARAAIASMSTPEGEVEGRAREIVNLTQLAYPTPRLIEDDSEIGRADRLDYERRILAAECGTQRVLNELEAELRWMADQARTNRDAMDPKAAEIITNIADKVAQIDVTAKPLPSTVRGEVIEECAKVADEIAIEMDNEHNRRLGVAKDLVETAEDVAAGIRALKGKPTPVEEGKQ